MGRMLFVCALLSVTPFVYAQRQMSVAEVVSFIKSSIQQKQDDRIVAEYIQKHVKMREKLDDRTVEDLEGMGAGPRTVAALKKLSAESASLPAAEPPKPAPPPPPPIPPPSSIEQKEILDQIRENALNYSNNLPNYICTQVTKRYVDSTGTGDHFRLMDTLHELLTFYDKKESYKVTMINGQMVDNRSHEKLGGATSSGEFGSMMYEIFAPQTETEFEWEKWGTVRGRRMYTYSFHVARDRSQYSIYHQASDRRVIAEYEGEIFADVETKQVIRINMHCVNLPMDFPIRSVAQTLDYGLGTISGHQFLLPLKTKLDSSENHYLVRNETEFRLYQKFETEEKITFASVDEDDKGDTSNAKPPATPPVKKP